MNIWKIKIELESLTSHPDVGVRGIADFGTDSDALQLRRQDIEHRPPVHERSRAQRNWQLVAGPIVVTAYLRLAVRDLNAIKRRHFRRVQIVQRPVESARSHYQESR